MTKPLGELLGEFLANLTFRGLSSKRIELVGASLGAHIASHAAVAYRQLTGRRPARLTGLLTNRYFIETIFNLLLDSLKIINFTHTFYPKGISV